jgi:predicted transcriptional regulator
MSDKSDANDRSVTVRIPHAVAEKLQALADADDRSLSYIVRKAMENYAENKPVRSKK